MYSHAKKDKQKKKNAPTSLPPIQKKDNLGNTLANKENEKQSSHEAIIQQTLHTNPIQARKQQNQPSRFISIIQARYKDKKDVLGNETTQLRAFERMANYIEQTTQLQTKPNNNAPQQQNPIQTKENKTGLPDTLKSGIENLSGYLMDDVNVHYNSPKPAQLQAHAYAQGTDIHLAAGQEKHLPHEAWHVVQQKQGRVKPTTQMKGKVNINDDAGLEHEADVMGKQALSVGITQKKEMPHAHSTSQVAIIQRASKTFERITDAKKGLSVSNTITWDEGENLSTLKVDDETPSVLFLTTDQKTLFDEAKIAEVELNPAKNTIMIYPENRKHGIWKLEIPRNIGGKDKGIVNPISWKFVGAIGTSGMFSWKKTYAKGREYLKDIQDLESVSAIANKIYANMLAKLEYVPAGSETAEDIISLSQTKGQCHVVNGAMGLLMQAGMAYKGKDVTVAEHTHESPFLTPNTETTSIIKGVSTNIKTDNESPYSGHRIKFDNHMWITVDGKVYDLVAGIKGSGADCVNQSITELEEGKYQWGSKILTKGTTPGAPWVSGYDMSDV